MKPMHIFLVFILLISGLTGVEGAPISLPGVRALTPSRPLVAASLKGLRFSPDDPFKFEFIVENAGSAQRLSPEESERLAEYFLAGVTTPDTDLWVNLSPFEKDRLLPAPLGVTQLGRDLLAEDFLLKQISSALVNPQKDLGREFWQKVYTQAKSKHGHSQISLKTINKVWIVADKADVVVENNLVWISNSRLKVMLDEDYQARQKSNQQQPPQNMSETLDVMRKVLLPALEKEVNEGKVFARLRQIYHALILAIWYKEKLKGSTLNQAVADQNKVEGINTNTFSVNREIYQQYVRAFKKGSFNFIQEDLDPVTQRLVPRKYFSGGINWKGLRSLVNRNHAMVSLKEVLRSAGSTFQVISVTLALLAGSPSSSNGQALPNQVPSSASLQGIDSKTIHDIAAKAEGGELQSLMLLIQVLQNTNDEAAKEALYLIRDLNTQKIPLTQANFRRLFLSFGNPSAIQFARRQIDRGDAEVAFEYVVTSQGSQDDPYLGKALKLMTVQLEEGKPLFQGQEMLPAYFLLKGFDLTNPDVQSVLKALAYRGLYAAVAAFESINYEGLDPHRVRLAIKDQSAAFHVLLGWFRKTSSKEVLTEAMEVLFNFQDKELDLSTKDIEEAKATSAIQELLRTDYFLNHALPNHTSALSLLAVLGHQRALDKLREVDPRVVEILEGQRLFEKANKGDKQALEEIISLAQQGRAQIGLEMAGFKEQKDLRYYGYLFHASFKNNWDLTTQKRVHSLIEPFFEFFLGDLWDGMEFFKSVAKERGMEVWKPFIESRMQSNTQAAIIYSFYAQDQAKVLALPSMSLGNLNSESNWRVKMYVLKAHLDRGIPIEQLIGGLLSTSLPILNLVESNSAFEFEQYILPTTNLDTILSRLSKPEDQFYFLTRLIYTRHPQGEQRVMAFLNLHPGFVDNLLTIYKFGQAFLKGPRSLLNDSHLLGILQRIDRNTITAYLKMKSTTEAAEWEAEKLLFLGNVEAFKMKLEFARISENAAKALLDDTVKLPDTLRSLASKLEVPSGNDHPIYVRLLALLGNKAAQTAVAKTITGEKSFAYSNIYSFERFDSPEFRTMVGSAEAYLLNVRTQGIEELRKKFRGMDAKASNEEMLKIYMAVLLRLQDKMQLVDVPTFRFLAETMRSKMNVSVAYENATSDYEFGFALMLKIKDIYELEDVAAHEIGHNLFAWLTRGVQLFNTVHFIAANEFIADRVADAYGGPVIAERIMKESEILCPACARLTSAENYFNQVREPHSLARLPVKMFVITAQKNKVDPYPILSAFNWQTLRQLQSYQWRFAHSEEFIYSVLQFLIGPQAITPYDKQKSFPDNLENLVKAAPRRPDRAMRALEYGGIDFTQIVELSSDSRFVGRSGGMPLAPQLKRITGIAIKDLQVRGASVSELVPSLSQ